MTCQIANVLKRQGVRKGDRVAIYMPVSPIAAATMLACTRYWSCAQVGGAVIVVGGAMSVMCL